MKKYLSAFLLFVFQIYHVGSAFGAVSENLYGHFRGILGSQKIVMDLIKTKEDLTGIYYYEKYGIPIVLRGTMMSNNEFVLREYDASGREMVITAKFKPDNSISGTWKHADSNEKALPVELKESYSGSVRFDVYELSDSLAFEKGLPESPYALTDLLFADIRIPSNKGLEKKLKGIIYEEFFNQSVSNGNVLQALEKERDSYFKSCLAEYKEWKEEQSASDGSYMAHLNRESDQWMSVRCNEKGILSVEIGGYEYLGGAHGMYGSSFLVLDAKKGKKLALKDIIRSEADRMLSELLDKKLREKYGISPYTDWEEVEDLCVLVDKIEPTENFYLTPQGIGFYYNPYEITCYAHGPEDIFVPFREIKGLLRPDFKY